MQVQTLTHEYQFTHGKKPQGEGNWMFKIIHIDNEGDIAKTEIMKYGVLSQIIKQIKKEYPNVYRIKVLP